MLSNFSCVCCLSVCLLLRNVYLGLLLFIYLFIFILSCINCLCILEINLMLMLPCKYFLLFWVWSLHFVYDFPCCAKFLSLVRFCFLIFVFIFIIPGGGLKKILLGFMSKCVLPILLSCSGSSYITDTRLLSAIWLQILPLIL